MKVGKESEKLEFKKSTGELKEAVISITAILNKHSSGELYFGVLNNGSPLGQMIGESTLRDVSQAIANHIQPQIYPKISEVSIDNKRCIYVVFSGDNAPYFAYGRGYIRVADEDKQMSPAEMEDYITRKIARKDDWDSETSNNTPDQIDEEIIKDYLERANLAKRIDFTYTTRNEVLTRLDLIDEGKIKNAAVALFRGFPLMEIQMAIFATTEKMTFNDIGRSGGNISQLIEAAERYIRNNIRWRVVFDGSLQRNEIPEIPIDAVREALFNSYCHRDFRSSQNNEIIIFSNRVEIYNPGTFPDGLSPDDYIHGTAKSIKRNPLLAQLMYYTKDIETFGTGLRRISNACYEAGVNVEFQAGKMGFTVIFYRPPMWTSDKNGDTLEYKATRQDIEQDNGIKNESDKDKSDVLKDVKNIGDNNASIGENIGNNVSSIGESIGDNNVSVGENGKKDSKSRILALMVKNPKISAREISSYIGIAPRNVEANIKTLKQAGLIERVGPNKGGHWVVKNGG